MEVVKRRHQLTRDRLNLERTGKYLQLIQLFNIFKNNYSVTVIFSWFSKTEKDTGGFLDIAIKIDENS